MSWREQFDRVERFLRRIENLSEDRNEYEDSLWAFFQNCWHLKDWIKNDPQVPPAVQQSVEDSVKESPALMICADLANRSKHFSLERIRRDANIPGRVWEAFIGGPDAVTTWHYRVTLDDHSERKALEVAREAVADWKGLLSKWGLM